LAIAALVLWVLTAAAGLVLLVAGSAAKRAAAQQNAAGQQPVPSRVPPVMVPVAGSAQPAADPGLSTASPDPSTAGPAEPPPIPRVKVHATPGEHPLLEFSHPLLGLIGLGVWFIFLGTHHAPLAWVAFGILVAAIAAGLSWLARNALAARRGERPARAGFPPRLVLVHGLAASATFVVAVLAALTASHV
jgi:UPF0716 family protein affecting phage T7 exclusion